MDAQLFDNLKKEVLKMLREKLPRNLFYHSPEHTLDVIDAVERIAIAEQCAPDEILLLKTASLFHDTGYILDMREHEKHGCEIAMEMLTGSHVGAEEMKIICGLIMATKVPQTPSTRLEEIICDADLDYLGRNDYFTIAENLHKEFLAHEKIKTEKDWIQLQLNFLQSHKYFTKSCIELRQPGVELNIEKIRGAVSD